jgi:hypothetical protein
MISKAYVILRSPLGGRLEGRATAVQPLKLG